MTSKALAGCPAHAISEIGSGALVQTFKRKLQIMRYRGRLPEWAGLEIDE
jgi:hypothetical protein